MSADFAFYRKERGGNVPILICPEHVQEALDETAGYVVDWSLFGRLHGDPPYVIVRLNGTVDRLSYRKSLARRSLSSNEF
jgi:hypothetical protein